MEKPGLYSDDDFKGGELFVDHNKSLNPLDIPKSFKIYFIPRNEWYPIVTLQTWFGHYQPLTIDTFSHTFPLQVIVFPLTRKYHYPFLKNTEVLNENMNLNQARCFNLSDIKEIQSKNNCKEHCIPIPYQSFFNSSEVKVCKSFANHFCAYDDIKDYIISQQMDCRKPKVEKYFRGMAK